MKKNIMTSIFAFSTLLLVNGLIAQQRAVTESGDTIFIYDNGTWSFELEDEIIRSLEEGAFMDQPLDIDTILTTFSHTPNVDKEVIPKSEQFKFKYNNENWKRVPPADLNEDAEFAFQHRDVDIWAILITEQTEIDVENLLKIAITNMEENTGTEVGIKKVELLNVNGAEILRGTLHASFSGINFIFDSYYYSDERGTTQFSTWTSEKIWENNQSLIHDFLNGFVVEQ